MEVADGRVWTCHQEAAGETNGDCSISAARQIPKTNGICSIIGQTRDIRLSNRVSIPRASRRAYDPQAAIAGVGDRGTDDCIRVIGCGKPVVCV